MNSINKKYFIAILLLFNLFLLLHNYVYAQKEANNWFFGTKAGLNFSTSPPTIIKSERLDALEGCASISDKDGNLLFYTDGRFVWNKSHQVMENGMWLNGHSSSTQSALIVPFPKNIGKYFVFTADACHNGLRNGLCYSIVDIFAESGKGAVVSKNKNLARHTCEKIDAVQNADTSEAWIITHEFESNRFFSFKISQNGIDTIPIISETGSIHQGTLAAKDSCGYLGNARGYLKASPLGNKLAVCVARDSIFELFDFDFPSGKVSNPITFSNFRYPYGAEFSPDGTKLYVQSESGDFGYPRFVAYIHQLDLLAGTEAEIKESLTLIAQNDNIMYGFGALQLGPDGRIYIAKPHVNTLDVIYKPNLKGEACNYQPNQFFFSDSAFVRFGLPNFVSTWFYKEDTADFTLRNICLGDTLVFSHNISYAKETSWYINQEKLYDYNNVEHIFQDTGKYEIKLICLKRYFTDTIVQYINVDPLPEVDLGENQTVCRNTPVVYDFSESLTDVKWNTGSEQLIYPIEKSGEYNMVGHNKFGCEIKDSVNIQYLPFPQVNLRNDTTICAGDSIVLHADTTVANYYWENDIDISKRIVKQSGTYRLTLVGENDCSNTDSVKIHVQPLPVFSLGKNIKACDGQEIKLQGPNGLKTYRWNTNQTEAIIIINKEDTYSLTVSDKYFCSYSDSIKVTFLETPFFDLGADTTICFGDTINLTGNNTDDEYLWSNNSSQKQMKIHAEGKYWLRITNNVNCAYSDTIRLSVEKLMPIEREWFPFCSNEPTEVKYPNNYGEVEWSDSSGLEINFPEKTGWHYYKTKNDIGCEISDSAYFTVFIPPVIDSVYLSRFDEITILAHSDTGINYFIEPRQDGLENVFSNLPNNSYTAIVIDANGCKSEKGPVVVENYELTIDYPNVFTPGNDGVNDILKLINIVPNAEKIEHFETIIYNRWGKKIHTSTDPANIWDGKNKFGYYPNGIYYWIIYITTKDLKKERYEGQFYLFREN